MPTYIDIHDLPGAVTAEDLAKTHLADQQVQGKHGVEYHKYWVNRKNGKLFCMCTAPSAEAAAAVHQEAHGNTALKIIEVTADLADAFMGASDVNLDGAALQPRSREYDTGTRTVLFTDIVGSTSLTQRLGDDAAITMVGVHDSIVRAALAGENGREVKHTGTASWRPFFRPPRPFVAVSRCSRISGSTALGIPIYRLEFASESPPANRSSVTTISSVQPSSWRRGFAPTPIPTAS
jgi:hypothetical protein